MATATEKYREKHMGALVVLVCAMLYCCIVLLCCVMLCCTVLFYVVFGCILLCRVVPCCALLRNAFCCNVQYVVSPYCVHVML